MKRIDVVMLTYNSNRSFFPLVLKSIKEYIPLNNLIVIDKFSNDGTVEVIRSYFPDARIIRTHLPLGPARALGIRLVESEFFAFVDSDAIVLPTWKRKLDFIKLSSVGAVEGSILNIRSVNDLN